MIDWQASPLQIPHKRMKNKHTAVSLTLLKKFLAGQPEAKAVFDKLPHSHQKEYADWIAGAKKPETIRRRLKRLVPMLLKKHPTKG